MILLKAKGSRLKFFKNKLVVLIQKFEPSLSNVTELEFAIFSQMSRSFAAYLPLAAQRCMIYGSYSTLVGTLNGYKRYYPVSSKTTDVSLSEFSSYLGSELRGLRKFIIGNATEAIEELFEYGGSKTAQVFFANSQINKLNKTNSGVDVIAMTITRQENSSTLNVNNTRYSISYEAMKNTYSQSEWTQFAILSNDGLSPADHLGFFPRTSFNRNNLIQVMTKVYAPVYFDVFKLKNNFSREMNRFLIDLLNNQKERAIKNHRKAAMRG